MIIQRHLIAIIAASVAATAACSSTDIEPTLGSGGTGSGTTGGAQGSGGSTGASSGGSTGASSGGGTASGGAIGTTGGAANSGGGTGESGGGPGSGGGDGQGSGGMTNGGGTEGPCDIYGAAGNECVAAYSTVRRLLSTYTGPLYQVRSGSSAENTGTGGMLHDIPQTADGFADKAAVDTACGSGVCTVATLYDQSGRENHLPVAKKGLSNGGALAATDDFETIATKGGMKVAGHDVYSLYMEARQGYRIQKVGNGMPVKKEAQGIYMLADGTHVGSACCWDFGNVTTNPQSYAEMNTLFFGKAYWGKGAGGGPWFGADFEAGVWMGGSTSSDPGWGGLNDPNPTGNPNNPTLAVKYALGFQKTAGDPDKYALRMADIAADSTVKTAYAGAYPTGKHIENIGAVVLGVGGDNSNYSWGTFYEGAIVQGYPDDATEDAVMQNIKALGYGQ